MKINNKSIYVSTWYWFSPFRRYCSAKKYWDMTNMVHTYQGLILMLLQLLISQRPNYEKSPFNRGKGMEKHRNRDLLSGMNRPAIHLAWTDRIELMTWTGRRWGGSVRPPWKGLGAERKRKRMKRDKSRSWRWTMKACLCATGLRWTADVMSGSALWKRHDLKEQQ